MIWWTNTQTEINILYIRLLPLRLFIKEKNTHSYVHLSKREIFLNLTLSFSSSGKKLLNSCTKKHRKRLPSNNTRQRGTRELTWGKLCAFEYFSNIIKRREKWNIILCYWIWNYVCDMLGSFLSRFFWGWLFYTSGGGMEADGFSMVERVMNGLKACSSWSLYVGRYDMTNMLVTSMREWAEGEKNEGKERFFDWLMF